MRYNNTYRCDICDYECQSRRAYNQHIKSTTHRIAIGDQVSPDDDVVRCRECGGVFGSRTTLWRHKKMCNLTKSCAVGGTDVEADVDGSDGIPSRKQVESLIDTTILTEVLKETRQMRDAFMEQNKTIENLRMENERQHRIIEEALPNLGNNITNVMNNNFNINVFLNEHCKNALNLSDFVNTIVVQIEDLDKTKNIGFVKGVTDIIVRNLRQLDVYSRPIHCSDPVQEIMYVKNDDTWHQDKDDKPMVRGAINAVAKKQINKVKDWEEQHLSGGTQSNVSDDYIKIIKHVTSSKTDEESKILQNIAREVVINKSS